MKKCKNTCQEWEDVQERKSGKSGKYSRSIKDQVDFDTKKNIIYLIQCKKENCQINRYVGETEKNARERISEQREYIYRNEKRYATGEHRKENEIYVIRKLNYFYNGINRSPGGS